MLIKTRGIVFKAITYSETSLICDIYTEEKGLCKYIISGVRTRKPKVNPSLLQVMTLLDMVAYHRVKKSMNRTKELKPAYIYTSLPFNTKKSAIGLFIAEVIQKTIKEEEANPPLFNFLFDSFIYLDQHQGSIANFHLYFLVQLSKFLGFMPHNNHSEKRPYFDLQEGIFVAKEPMEHALYLKKKESIFFSKLLSISLEEIEYLKLERASRQQLLDYLILFYRLHIENFQQLNSHEILQSVFE